MGKPRNGSLGRKVKMSQPIAIPWDLAIDLVAAKVVKPPTVPKMEPMEKWIVAGGRSFDVSHDDGLTVVTLTAPGIDGDSTFEGVGETLPLATARAIQELWKATPKPDPNGADLPLFKGNGGVASVAEMGLQAVSVDEIARDLEAEIRAGAVPGVSITDDGRVSDADPVRTREDDGWRHMQVIAQQDGKLWKREAPVDLNHAPILVWEEGGGGDIDRGFWLAPGYVYDRELGEIRDQQDGRDDLCWSRPTRGAVEATRVKLVTTAADA